MGIQGQPAAAACQPRKGSVHAKPERLLMTILLVSSNRGAQAQAPSIAPPCSQKKITAYEVIVLVKKNHTPVSIVVYGSSEKEISTCTEVCAAALERQGNLAQPLEEVGTVGGGVSMLALSVC